MATIDEIRNQAYGDLVKAGQAITSPEYLKQTPLPSQQVAGLQPTQNLAAQVATAATQGPDYYGMGVGALQDAANTAQQAMTTGLAGAQMYDPQSYQAFMSPYQQEVIDNYTREMQRQFDISRQARAAQAIGSGAFGGGREGVYEAEARRGFQDQLGAGVSGLLQSGYQQAQAQAQTAYENQQKRMQQAAQQQLGAGQVQQGIGQLYGQFAPSAAETAQRQVQTLGGIGATQQATAQAANEAAYKNALAEYLRPYQALQFQAGLVGGFPSGVQQQFAETTNPLLSGISNLIGNIGG